MENKKIYFISHDFFNDLQISFLVIFYSVIEIWDFSYLKFTIPILVKNNIFWYVEKGGG